jgi:hypothetical protein
MRVAIPEEHAADFRQMVAEQARIDGTAVHDLLTFARRESNEQLAEVLDRLGLTRAPAEQVGGPGDGDLGVRIADADLDQFRLLLREQVVADHELIGEVHAGVAEGYEEADVLRRIELVWAVAEQVGGIY